MFNPTEIEVTMHPCGICDQEIFLESRRISIWEEALEATFIAQRNRSTRRRLDWPPSADRHEKADHAQLETTIGAAESLGPL